MLRVLRSSFFSSAAAAPTIASLMNTLRELNYWTMSAGSGHEPELRPQPIPNDIVGRIAAFFEIKPETQLGTTGVSFGSLLPPVRDSFLAELTAQTSKGNLKSFIPNSTATDAMLKDAATSVARTSAEIAARENQAQFREEHPAPYDCLH